MIGGSWDYWWLKTPLPGIVWCNCPHMTGLDGMKVEDLTKAEFEGRRRIHAMVDHVRARLPGFAHCYVVDVAPQTGVRQTRMLQGEYVVTKEDITGRTRFADSIARGRDYFTPYRALLPCGVEQLLVAGPPLLGDAPSPEDLARDPAPAWRWARPRASPPPWRSMPGRPCALWDVPGLQRRLEAAGADPGAHPALAERAA